MYMPFRALYIYIYLMHAVREILLTDCSNNPLFTSKFQCAQMSKLLLTDPESCTGICIPSCKTLCITFLIYSGPTQKLGGPDDRTKYTKLLWCHIHFCTTPSWNPPQVRRHHARAARRISWLLSFLDCSIFATSEGSQAYIWHVIYKIDRCGVMPYKNSWNTPSPRAGKWNWIDWYTIVYTTQSITHNVMANAIGTDWVIKAELTKLAASLMIGFVDAHLHAGSSEVNHTSWLSACTARAYVPMYTYWPRHGLASKTGRNWIPQQWLSSLCVVEHPDCGMYNKAVCYRQRCYIYIYQMAHHTSHIIYMQMLSWSRSHCTVQSLVIVSGSSVHHVMARRLICPAWLHVVIM